MGNSWGDDPKGNDATENPTAGLGDSPATPASAAPSNVAAPVAAGSDAPDPFVGLKILDQYTVEKKLGAGGMGAVYLADQTTIGRKAAIKFLLPEISASKELVARFYREAKSASSLSHPNIVQVYNFGQTESGALYLAMEYIDGQALSALIRRQPLPARQVCELGIQLADALELAHGAAVIHRDLKPENIMVRERNGRQVPTILDFGIAKIVAREGEDETNLTATGNIFGTPKYMAPEQAQGHAIDHRVDIYALGVILYQMLTGELPIRATTPVAQLVAAVNNAPRPFSEHKQVRVPPALERLVMRMLAKEASDRPPSMRAVRDELERCLHSSTGLGRLPGGRAAAAVVLVALAGLFGWLASVQIRELGGTAALFGSGARDSGTTGGASATEPGPAGSGAVTAAGAPRLLRASQPDKPEWVGRTGNDQSGRDAWIFYGVARERPALDEARTTVRNAVAEEVLLALVARLDVKNFAPAVYQPILAAKGKLLAAAAEHAQSGQALEARRHQAALDETEAYIYTMLAERFADLLRFDDVYWEEWQRGSAATTDFFARFTVTPSRYAENYYAQVKTVAGLGILGTHFFPPLTWVHGRINGVVVLDVTAGGPAAKAGLRVGDVIVRAGEAPVNGLMAFVGLAPTLVRQSRAKEGLALTISRAGTLQTLTLGGRPKTR